MTEPERTSTDAAPLDVASRRLPAQGQLRQIFRLPADEARAALDVWLSWARRLAPCVRRPRTRDQATPRTDPGRDHPQHVQRAGRIGQHQDQTHDPGGLRLPLRPSPHRHRHAQPRRRPAHPPRTQIHPQIGRRSQISAGTVAHRDVRRAELRSTRFCSVRLGESGLWSVHHRSSTFADVHKSGRDQVATEPKTETRTSGTIRDRAARNRRFPLSEQRRMRDSNPRRLAPNPLSKRAP